MKTKLCISTYGKTIKELEERIKEAAEEKDALIEARIDYLEENEINPEALSEILKPFADRLVITVRKREQGGHYKGGEASRIELIKRLSKIQPAYVDIELESANGEIIGAIKENGSMVIVSWHDFSGTPSKEELIRKAGKCLERGDIAKIVATSRSVEDNLNILYLYSVFPAKRLIAFCMGEKGKITRLLSACAGSPITYVAQYGRNTAPGQYSIEEFRKIVGKAVGAGI